MINNNTDEQIYYARNFLTGLYWNGKDFSSDIENAKKIGYNDIPIIKYCWSNVSIVS
jgi:hypothetical protein